MTPWTCVCGRSEWQQGGATVRPTGVSSWYACRGCGREGMNLSRTLSVFLLPAEGTRLSESAFDWVNTALAITSRAYEQAVQAVASSWEEEHVYGPLRASRGPRPHERREGLLLAPNELFAWDREADRLLADRPPPYILVHPPALPLLPDDLVAYVLYPGGWRSVDREACQEADVPSDPLRETHMRSFRRAFAAVGVYRWQEVRNHYYDDLTWSEPWFEFKRGPRMFLVGPRKRVVNVTVTSAERFSIRAVREAAARDRVTYQDDAGAAYDQATKVTVHAWTDEKLVEYLKLLLGEVTTP